MRIYGMSAIKWHAIKCQHDYVSVRLIVQWLTVPCLNVWTPKYAPLQIKNWHLWGKDKIIVVIKFCQDGLNLLKLWFQPLMATLQSRHSAADEKIPI